MTTDLHPRHVDSPHLGHAHSFASEPENLAAKKQLNRGTRILVLRAIVDSGSKGLTREETARKTHLPLQSVCGRVRDCVKRGWVYETTRTRKTNSGSPAAVLCATDAGIQEVASVVPQDVTPSDVPAGDLHPLHESNAFKKAQRLEALVRTLHVSLSIPVSPQEYACGFTQNIWDALGRVLKEERNPNLSIPICLSLLGEERAA